MKRGKLESLMGMAFFGPALVLLAIIFVFANGSYIYF